MGVIHKIDIRTIEKVLLEAKNENYKGKLFFNLSPKVLVLKDFIESVTSIVKDIGFEPANMVFEITERDTVRSLDMLRNFTLSLRKEGFKFAIDDFGSGFSSFMYLCQRLKYKHTISVAVKSVFFGGSFSVSF